MRSPDLRDASQGFLPESADRFATDVIYPAFSPQMGVFFVCSTAYGVWKVSYAPHRAADFAK